MKRSSSTKALEKKLLAFFKEMAAIKEIDNYESERDKFVFHMTDWQDTLGSLERLFSCPDDFDQDQANRLLQELFFHMLPHLNAAAEIYDDAVSIYKMHNKQTPD